MLHKRVVVIGAGPAGMMAAIRAAELGAKVELLEKNPAAGRKLLLSGKGRCNLTNACALDEFLERFPSSGQFLRDSFKKFFNNRLMEFFEQRGLKLKVERQQRVFPRDDRSGSILAVLTAELARLKVIVQYKTAVCGIALAGKQVCAAELAAQERVPADAVVLAAGGVSYPQTGSSGDGFQIARRLGHTIVPLRPGLVGFDTAGRPGLQGLTLKNIRVAFSGGPRRIESETGELLFTHTGISGPLVFTLSGRVVDILAAGRRVTAEIDLKPALSHEQLNNRFLREFAQAPRILLKNALKEFLPSSLIGYFLRAAQCGGDMSVSHITRPQRQKMVETLKCLPFEITGSRPIKEAMVTRGGVSLKEINPRTMESRLIKGLYFAGEIIDVDADTGGFNLQAAFSTGYLAGESAALRVIGL